MTLRPTPLPREPLHARPGSSLDRMGVDKVAATTGRVGAWGAAPHRDATVATEDGRHVVAEKRADMGRPT